MFQDIFVIIMGVIVVGAGIWVWWMDNSKEKDEQNKDGEKVGSEEQIKQEN